MNPGEQGTMPGMEMSGGSGGAGAMGGQQRSWLLPVVVVLAIGVLWYMQAGAMTAKVTGEYQAVFLTNNQVYFGKATDLNKQYVKLSDVYYLQLQPQQPAAPAPRFQQPAAAPVQPQFTLLKLGQEIHGPLQEMLINRDQILLIEGLRDDSKVVKAIADAKEKEEADAEAAEEEEEPVKKPAAKKTTK